MKFIEWSREYEVGIKEIDEQHQVLVNLINQLDEAIRSKKGSKKSAEILDDLVDYTKVHFTLEESLMRLMGYPDLEAHQAIHVKLIENVTSLKEKVEDGQASITFELMAFLKTWLTRHIMESDQQYSRHFKNKGLTGNSNYMAWQNEVAQEPKARPWWKFW